MADGGGRTAKVTSAALPHLDKHHGAVWTLHDQVYFAPASAGGPIIALQQPQAACLQKGQRLVFARITPGFGRGLTHFVFFEELH
jgi:hypothetical protein